MASLQDAQLHQVVLELVLLRDLYQIVAGLVQVGVAHGERRLELEQLVRELDHRAGHGAGLRRDANGVASAAPKRQRPAHAGYRGQLGVRAAGALPLHARQLVLDLRGKRHLFTIPLRRGYGRGAEPFSASARSRCDSVTWYPCLCR